MNTKPTKLCGKLINTRTAYIRKKWAAIGDLRNYILTTISHELLNHLAPSFMLADHRVGDEKKHKLDVYTILIELKKEFGILPYH